MSSTVLLVDAERQVRSILERHLDPAQWTLVQIGDGDVALQTVKDLPPVFIVVNVDIAKGWPLCTQLKRLFPAIPVIVVSFRLGKEVFNNHQKLDTRADAYHRLPEELEGLEISLSYFSSHKSETGQDDEDSAPNRPRPRRGRVQVPTGVVQRLESTVAEQARALEDARRQIEALEVERDAVAEKNRRQMLELMTVAPAPALDGTADSVALKERIATLEAEVLLSSRRDDELRDLRNALAARTAEIERAHSERATAEIGARQAALALDEARHAEERTRLALEAQLNSLRTERAHTIQRVSELEEAARSGPAKATNEQLEAVRETARREANESAEQLTRASEQLSLLANELTAAHQIRLQSELDRRVAEERAATIDLHLAQALQRAETAESAWSGVNARLEQAQAALAAKGGDTEQLLTDKKAVEQALATSRRLMREYATDAARKAEELKTAHERTKELEAQATGFDAQKEELTQALEFEKSLVESLEKDLAAARAVAASAPAEVEARETFIAMMRADLETANEALEAERAKSSAELAKAQKIAYEDIETLRLVTQSELDDVRASALREVEAAREQARVDVATAVEAQRRQASGAHAAERDALASHVATVHARFEALVAYARGLEARLVGAETLRGAVEAKLEELVTEVRSQALSGEIPPPMDLPRAPTTAPSD